MGIFHLIEHNARLVPAELLEFLVNLLDDLCSIFAGSTGAFPGARRQQSLLPLFVELWHYMRPRYSGVYNA
jgi:hypothetical protein